MTAIKFESKKAKPSIYLVRNDESDTGVKVENSGITVLSFEDLWEKYGHGYTKFYIQKFAKKSPPEHINEIYQEAWIRLFETYEKIDFSGPWKSYTQFHCKGAVLDYLKSGEGYMEDKKSSKDPKPEPSETDTDNLVRLPRLSARVEITDDEGLSLSIDEIAGMFGLYHSRETLTPLSDEPFQPNWDLLNRMAPKDENLHIICKTLLGFTQEKIAEQLGFECDLKTKETRKLTRERVSQRIYEFIEKLDSPIHIHDPWVNQCIYALGLSHLYNMNPHDNGIGWDYEPFDLTDDLSFEKVNRFHTPTFFDFVSGAIQEVH